MILLSFVLDVSGEYVYLPLPIREDPYQIISGEMGTD
jgi:hypothetical protein